ncbi:hypothetical protein MSG28_015397 [Choristoneura fumiferana]|uniref:Uncharacterized protein n=1 Tax=Choristoneura fumiferana TaxID=7141 RepID=A0ACC0KAR3_CHOFU|nr:hypothetical protein MSG28_015397 [Choristoneura fumiferana]
MDTGSESPTDSNRQEGSKTSFLIEDILYRGQIKPQEPRRYEFDREPKPFFPVPGELRPVPREGSYLQVAMGALGAYLHAPNTYKAVETPYFLSQGVPYHALFTPSELSLSALKHCRRRKAHPALPVDARARGAGRSPEPLGDAGQDLVPEQTDETQETDAKAATAAG